MAAIPAWKQALLDRKRQQENQEKQKDNEEESRLAKLPPWKRDLILKKKQASVSNHNGGSAVINDNMSFSSAPVKKTESRPVPTTNTRPESQYEENRNVQINGGASTVTCRDVYNANIANGHTTSVDNKGDSIDSHESELQYQPGIVSKLRSRFKAEKTSEESVQSRRRSMTHESHDPVSPGLPRSTSSDTKVLSRESKPSRVSPTINPPAKPDIHDNNNIPNGTVTLDSVDADTDFSIQSSNTTKDISVKNKVSSILSVFETEKSKSQPAGKRNSCADLPVKSYGVSKSSVINEPVAKRPESQLTQSKADTTTVTRRVVTTATTVARQPEQKVVVRKSVEVKPDTETSDANLEKIRQAGNSWLFSSDSTKTTANQKPISRHVTSAEDKPQEEIETSNTTIDDVPSFALPPATLPSNGNLGNQSERGLTLNLNVAADDKKNGSKTSQQSSPKKKAKVDKKSPTSPEKSKPKSEKVISPDKKKGFFGSLRKDKTKVKVVEVKSTTNPNFVVHGVDSPASLNKRKAPVAPSGKTRAPAPPKAAPVREQPRPQAKEEETKPKANVPTSLPATERKTVVLQSNTFHVSPDSDVPVTNIDDVILDSEQTVTSSEPAQDNFDYDFLDEQLAITPRPVKFSSVEFAGAGVKLDKSSLTQKVKGQKKNLKIQFEETTPETFEYPSEQSMMDSPGQHPPVGDGGGESSTDDSDMGEPEPPVTSTLSSNSALGAGVLGGYRGKFVDDYQLGNRPSEPREDHMVRARQNSTSDRESDSGDEVVINPADEDETFQWSESASADILF